MAISGLRWTVAGPLTWAAPPITRIVTAASTIVPTMATRIGLSGRVNDTPTNLPSPRGPVAERARPGRDACRAQAAGTVDAMPGSAVSDLAGRVLAGRYLLHGAVGTGASGRVYVAEDTRLKRRVAVKVLHAALAEDAAFLRRFRAEAQLAASLHHPHIVTVHDWGEDDVPFMVLELLEGGSLRSMLDQGTFLTVPQAARVGRDVASALEYAHARGVLHRDIKPANLLFDEHGIVRVADFGLARALAEASWTEPAGAVFGTARYASPEQARGAQLDARSDLYSLALVLVESVTGRLPFAADTTLGMLTARTLEPIVASEELGPLESVIDRVGAIDPNDRYPDAATMRQAISDAADALPPPGPLLLAGMVDRADPHPTRAAPERSAPLFDQDAAEIVRDRSAAERRRRRRRAEANARAHERIPGQRRLVPWIVAIVLILTVGLAAAALAQVSSAAPIPVPGLEGLTVGEGDREREGRRAAGDARPEPPRPDPKGTVIAQTPGAGRVQREPPRDARGVVGPGRRHRPDDRRREVDHGQAGARRRRPHLPLEAGRRAPTRTFPRATSSRSSPRAAASSRPTSPCRSC